MRARPTCFVSHSPQTTFAAVILAVVILLAVSMPLCAIAGGLASDSGDKQDPFGGAYPKMSKNTLAAALNHIGITAAKVTRFRFVGDESSDTSGLAVVEADADTIRWIWERMFDTAEPYHFWLPSGNRTLEIYVQGKQVAAATCR